MKICEEIEALSEQLHEWYLEATRELDPENYNPKAQKSYAELNEQQKQIDRYIARKVQAAIDKATERYAAEYFNAGYKTREMEAAKAYEKAVRRLHGQFAKTNF